MIKIKSIFSRIPLNQYNYMTTMPICQFSSTQYKVNPVENSQQKNFFPHPIWNEQEVLDVKIMQKEPETIGDEFAKFAINIIRTCFDVVSGYKKLTPQNKQKPMSEKQWIRRCIFLETLAGVPGSIAAMHKHLKALRKMEKKSCDWIQKLSSEAENEKVHLQTFLDVKNPGYKMKALVQISHIFYVGVFGLGYMLSPKMCHRVVGYLEEEAVRTYTGCIDQILQENSPISHWKTLAAPEIAIQYWNLQNEATMLDAVYAIRKDEENHRDVNHEIADQIVLQKQNQIIKNTLENSAENIKV